MSGFWGYLGADTIAIIVIGSMSFVCLLCAIKFVSNYGE